MNIIIKKEKNIYIATCLELNIESSSSLSPQAAFKNLIDVISIHLENFQENNNDIDKLFANANKNWPVFTDRNKSLSTAVESSKKPGSLKDNLLKKLSVYTI